MSIDIIQSAKWVEIFLLATFMILVVFDIYLFLNDTPGDTISNIIRDWVYDRFFFITYFWGVLAGHFFLGTDETLIGASNELSLVIVLSIAVILLVFGIRFKKSVKPLHQTILFIFGAVIGHYFWSLNI